MSVNIVTSKAESLVLENMLRKERQADAMYAQLIANMSGFQKPVLRAEVNGKLIVEVPQWLTRK